MSLSLGKYRLDREIGRGGMGVVYEANDAVLQRRVALKVLRLDKAETPEDLKRNEKRFLQEARLSARLNHPDIVTVYEAGIIEGRRYISMEFLEAKQFGKWRQFGPSPRAQVALLARVARAIHHAHEQSIVHRDLKPQNILVDEKGNPHVTDFGLARTLAEDVHLTGPDLTVGTPVYMSPEQAEGSRTLDGRTDVYALGVMLFEVLTNRVPYTGDSAMQVLVRATQQPIPRPSRMGGSVTELAKDEALERICVKALAKDPSARPPSAAAFAEALEGWLEGRPTVEARRNGRRGSSRATLSGRGPAARPSTRRTRRSSTRPQGLLWAGAAVAAGALAILVPMAISSEGAAPRTAAATPRRTGPPDSSRETHAAEAIRTLEALSAAGSDPDAILARCREVRPLTRGTPYESRLREIETGARKRRAEREESARLREAIASVREMILADPEARRRVEILALLDSISKTAGPRHREVDRIRTDYEALLAKLDALKGSAGDPAPVRFAEGLVAYWRLDDGGSSKSAKDASGRNLHGRLLNGPEWVRGWKGLGLRFDGLDDYVEFPDTAELRFLQNDDFTITAWFKPDAAPSSSTLDANESHFAILCKGGWGEGVLYRFDRKFVLNHWLKGGVWVGTMTAFGGASPDRWHHTAVTVSRARGESRIFVDGKFSAAARWSDKPAARTHETEPMAAKRWRMGILNPGAPKRRYAARGIIDEVRVYARALEDREIREIHAADCANPTR